MSKGDEYAKVMRQILVYMYQEGAIGNTPTTVVKVDEIVEMFELDLTEAVSVMKLLDHQGYVTGRTGGYYWLTGRGFEQAERLSKSKNST